MSLHDRTTHSKQNNFVATSSDECLHNIKVLQNCLNIFPQSIKIYVSLQLLMQNVVSAQPCVGKLGISLVLLNFLHCNFRLWFKTP